ncbi:MAG: hypothetical protein ABFD75_05240 [Smithella sp.]
MLQYLDAIIAFTVIILALSLLITILIQMISAILGYRGVNLRWGLKKLLETVEPKLAEKADSLAQEILEAPLISDSLWSKFTYVPLIGKMTKRWRLASAITKEELVIGLKNMAEIKEKNQTKKDDKRIAVQTSIGKIEAGFDVVMKRASQRFTMQTRIWTIILAVLISFGARVDSFSLFQQIWSNQVMRTNLIGQSEMLLNEASVILAVKTNVAQSSTYNYTPQILKDAMEQLKKEDAKSTAGLPATPTLMNMADMLKWLQVNLKTDEATRDNILNKYQLLVIDELKKHADTIQKGLAKSGFALQIPTSCKDFKSYYAGYSIWGIMITAAFLSLGSPFWFNTLKMLSSLRPLATASTKAPSKSA